ncbi:hypothetical protein [Priestia aryabhattai]
MIDLNDVVVLCDKPSDEKIFKQMQRHSTNLKEIQGVEVLPLQWKKHLPDEYIEGMAPLLQFDRADYYFCYKGYPFLVLEMTEHGYTGDQCLQRFARISKTAEKQIPFIYFAPHSRTRFDELHQDKPSYRNVSSDLFSGFVKLMDIYDSPVVTLGWKTNDRGIPMKLAANSPEETGLKDLIELLDNLLSERLEEMINKSSINETESLKPHIQKTIELSEKSNVGKSEVRISGFSYSNVLDIVSDPLESLKYIPREYFMKGKSHKLITLMCVENSRINKLVLPNGQIIRFNGKEELDSLLPDSLKQKPWLFYHSGYQWRSEPNVGIVTNIDINHCRSLNGKTTKDRDNLLVVHWPRVFFERTSTLRLSMLDSLGNNEESAPFMQLVAEKAALGRGRQNGEKFIQVTGKAIGAWNERATVARVYRDTCDLLILNDAIVLGNMWAEEFK